MHSLSGSEYSFFIANNNLLSGVYKMNLLYRFINEIKNKSLDLYLLLFFVGCFVLLKIKDPVRVYLSYALFIGLLVILYLKRKRAREIIIHFIRFESGGVVNKLAGWASLLAWGGVSSFSFCNKYTVWFSCKSTVSDVLHFYCY